MALSKTGEDESRRSSKPPAGGEYLISSTLSRWSALLLSRVSFWRRPWTIRTALAWFALSAVLPALLFIALQYRASLVEKEAEVEREGRRFAAVTATDVGRELAVKRAQLGALATSLALRGGDYAAFSAQARAVLKDSPGQVSLLRRNGEHIPGINAPFGALPPHSRILAAVENAVATGRADESDLFRDSLSQQFVVCSLYPIGFDDLVLVGTLPVAELSGALQRALPTEWLAVLVDRTGAVIARNRRAANFADQTVSPPVWQRISTATDGWLETTTHDHVDLFTSWRRLPNGWTAIVSVPQSVLRAPLHEWGRQVFWNLILFSALALAGAAVAGKWISRAMAELTAAAATIGTGGIAPPVKTGLRELNEVGEVLSRASRERRSAERALRESDERFRAIFDQTSTGIFVIDPAGRFMVANQRQCDIVGYSDAELRGRTVLGLTYPDDQTQSLDMLRSLWSDGSFELELRLVRKDGRTVWVHVSSAVVRDDEGKPLCAIGVVLDVTERKNAEMSNAHLAALVASSGDAIKSLAVDGTVLTWNPAAERLFGYATAEIVGKPLDILVPTDRMGEFRSMLEGARRGENVRGETLWRRRDGSLIEVSIDAAPLRAADGSINGILSIARDITERRKGERALLESEERLRRSLGELEAIYRTAPVGLAVLDRELRFVHINDRVVQMDGLSVEDHIGRHVRDVLPAMADEAERIFKAVIRTGKPILAVEITGAAPNQAGPARTWVASWHPLLDSEGKPAGVNVVAEEITERKRAQAMLQEREEQFRTLANSIPQLAWMANPDGGITWYNDRWYEYTGADPEDVLGWSWTSVHEPDALPAVVERWKESLATGEPLDMTFALKGADGVFRPFLTRAVPILDGAGQIGRWLGTNTDITAQKEHEAHMNFVMRELSHRSKNLLAVVQAMARQTMQHSSDFEDFESRFMGRMNGLARSHDVLVRQDWAGAAIRDLVGAQLAPFANEDGEGIDVDGPDLMLKPDAVQNLGFALFELATNAVKYGALAVSGGRVQIRWELANVENQVRVRFLWSETGGPPVSAPGRKGFGTVVIERFMAAAFGGKAESSFPPEGFRWTLEIPAEHLLSEAPRHPAERRNAAHGSGT